MGTGWKAGGDWSGWYIVAWCVWVVIAVGGFFVLELYALWDKNDRTMTLTELLTRYVPGWTIFALMGALAGWLGWHFIASKNQHDMLGQDLPHAYAPDYTHTPPNLAMPCLVCGRSEYDPIHEMGRSGDNAG